MLTNAAVAIGLAFNGAGTWSVDHALGWELAGVGWGLGALGVAALGAAFVPWRRALTPQPAPTAA